MSAVCERKRVVDPRKFDVDVVSDSGALRRLSMSRQIMIAVKSAEKGALIALRSSYI